MCPTAAATTSSLCFSAVPLLTNCCTSWAKLLGLLGILVRSLATGTLLGTAQNPMLLKILRMSGELRTRRSRGRPSRARIVEASASSNVVIHVSEQCSESVGFKSVLQLRHCEAAGLCAALHDLTVRTVRQPLPICMHCGALALASPFR